jgi:hypothetical protein
MSRIPYLQFRLPGVIRAELGTILAMLGSTYMTDMDRLVLATETLENLLLEDYPCFRGMRVLSPSSKWLSLMSPDSSESASYRRTWLYQLWESFSQSRRGQRMDLVQLVRVLEVLINTALPTGTLDSKRFSRSIASEPIVLMRISNKDYQSRIRI